MHAACHPGTFKCLPKPRPAAEALRVTKLTRQKYSKLAVQGKLL